MVQKIDCLPEVLILNPYGRQFLPQVYKLRMTFLEQDFKVRLLEKDDRPYTNYGAVLVPDTGGLNSTVGYCIGNVCVPPQDNAVEYWRLNTLQYFVNKQIPIAGIGMSAFLIFAEVLRGKLQYGPDGMSFGAAKKDYELILNGFVAKNAAGLYQFDPLELPDFVRSLLTPPPDNNEPSMVLVWWIKH